MFDDYSDEIERLNDRCDKLIAQFNLIKENLDWYQGEINNLQLEDSKLDKSNNRAVAEYQHKRDYLLSKLLFEQRRLLELKTEIPD